MVGFMMVTQTICQIPAEIVVPLPELIAKAGTFLVLSGFALHFNSRLYRSLTPVCMGVNEKVS